MSSCIAVYIHMHADTLPLPYVYLTQPRHYGQGHQTTLNSRHVHIRVLTATTATIPTASATTILVLLLVFPILSQQRYSSPPPPPFIFQNSSSRTSVLAATTSTAPGYSCHHGHHLNRRHISDSKNTCIILIATWFCAPLVLVYTVKHGLLWFAIYIYNLYPDRKTFAMWQDWPEETQKAKSGESTTSFTCTLIFSARRFISLVVFQALGQS